MKTTTVKVEKLAVPHSRSMMSMASMGSTHEAGTHKSRRLPGWAASAQSEANEYFHSLLVPEDGSARYPDLSGFPTVPVHSRYFFQANFFARATSGEYLCALSVVPSLRQQYRMGTAYAADGTITWDSGNNSPIYASATTSFSCYRPISLSVTLHDTRTPLNRNGAILQDLQGFQRSDGSQNSYPSNISIIQQSPTVKIGTASQDYLNETPRQAWIPVLQGSNEFYYIQMQPEVTVPGSFATPAVLFLIDLGTTAPVGSLIFEVNYNFEAVVLPSAAALFDPKPSLGDPSDIAKTVMKNIQEMYKFASSTVQSLTKYVGPLSSIARGIVGAMGPGPKAVPMTVKNPKLASWLQSASVDPELCEGAMIRLTQIFSQYVDWCRTSRLSASNMDTLLKIVAGSDLDQLSLRTLQRCLDVFKEILNSPERSGLVPVEFDDLSYPPVLKRSNEGVVYPRKPVLSSGNPMPALSLSKKTSVVASGVPETPTPSPVDKPSASQSDGWFNVRRT